MENSSSFSKFSVYSRWLYWDIFLQIDSYIINSLYFMLLVSLVILGEHYKSFKNKWKWKFLVSSSKVVIKGLNVSSKVQMFKGLNVCSKVQMFKGWSMWSSPRNFPRFDSKGETFQTFLLICIFIKINLGSCLFPGWRVISMWNHVMYRSMFGYDWCRVAGDWCKQFMQSWNSCTILNLHICTQHSEM